MLSYSLDVVPDARVHVEDVVADEPDEVGEVWHGRLVDDELEHALLVDAVDVEGERAHGDAHHALAVVEELDRLRVEREVVRVLKRNASKVGLFRPWTRKRGLNYGDKVLEWGGSDSRNSTFFLRKVSRH